MVSVSAACCCGMAVGVLSLVYPTQCVRPMLSTPQCALCEYCCRVTLLFSAGCVVRGWCVSVRLCCSCGGVSSAYPPLVAVVGGAVVDGGACSVMVGGMMMGRAAVSSTLPSVVSVPRLVRRWPCRMAGGCCDAPCWGWVWRFVLRLFPPPFFCITLHFSVFAVTALLV